MYCQNCGKQIIDDSVLCASCEQKAKEQQAHDEWRAQMAQRLNQRSGRSGDQVPPSKKAEAYCASCGAKLSGTAAFCSSCGTKSHKSPAPSQPAEVQSAAIQSAPLDSIIPQKEVTMFCPKCGSHNIDVQVYQENKGGKTVTRSKSKYKEKRHSIIWRLCIGWWWWIIDLFFWIFLFPIRFLVQLFKKKDYTGKTKTTEKTRNKIAYKSVYLCKDCGRHWEK